MEQKHIGKSRYKFIMSLLNWGFNTGIWAAVWMTRYADIIPRPFGYKGHWLVVAVYGFLLFSFTLFYGGYRIGYYRTEDMAFAGLWGMLFTNAVTYLQTCLVGAGIMDPRPFLVMSLFQGVLIAVWAVLVNRRYHKIFPPRTMLLIYGGRSLANSLIRKLVTRSEKYLVQEVANACELDFEELCQRIIPYESVVLCDVDTQLRNRLLKHCFEQSVRTYTTPCISDILLRGSEDISLFDTPLLLNRNSGLGPGQAFLKRAMDIVLSVLGLAVLFPFMAVAAVIIKVYDGGPVFYRQTRLTLGGREFRLIKFRSMVVEAEKQCGATLSPKEDDRITPFGRLMRRVRFDELPQLLNILRGEMSFVGPRPERPELAEQYMKEMPEFSYRLKVKAGLTGYAQIVGRYNTTPYDKLKMDLMYIARYSILEDLKLILLTFKVILIKSSTEGVDTPKSKSPKDKPPAL